MTAARPSPKEVEAARAYETLHVPALFGAWAGPVLDAADVRPGDTLLDVACGTGVLARAARARVGPEGAVVGVDIAPGMLAVAAEREPGAAWRHGAAEDLPCEDGEFDVVVSQFGLMFFSDRTRALNEMRRVLRPGGRLCVAVWDALENSGAYPVEVALLESMAGREAADALRAPFALGDAADLHAQMASAGFADVEVQTRSGRACFPSVRSLVEADLRGWLPMMGVHLDEDLIRSILAEAEVALGDFVDADGRAAFDTPAHLATARPAPC